MTGVVTCPRCGGSVFVADPVSAPADDGTLRDRDQTASDQDQTSSDHDQTASDRDQRSANEDQDAADDDVEEGRDDVTHERTRLAREQSKRDREIMSESRDQIAAKRLEIGEDRDRSADARDRVARQHDLRDDANASREDILLRTERDRARAAADRAEAAHDRARAAADRKELAHLRSEARDILELAATDELTGAWTRKLGLATMVREIERARRTGAGLMLAFIDVDDLKTVNDTQGHLAGDRLLRLVVETVRANVRPYDLIVRYGGDEFLCVMPSMTRVGAKQRMDRITAALTGANEGHSITFGLAEHEPADGLEELISRADAELLNARRRRKGHE